MNEFVDAVADAKPGATIVYATGDLAYSAQSSPELHALRSKAFTYYECDRGALLQRRRSDLRFVGAGGGCCFQYLFVKAPAEARA